MRVRVCLVNQVKGERCLWKHTFLSRSCGPAEEAMDATFVLTVILPSLLPHKLCPLSYSSAMARAVSFLKTQAATLDKMRERLQDPSDPSRCARHQASTVYHRRLLSVGGTGTMCSNNNIQAVCEPHFSVWGCLAGCTAALNVSDVTAKRRNITASLKCLLPWLGGDNNGHSAAACFPVFRVLISLLSRAVLSEEMVHSGFHLFGSWYDWSLADVWEEQGRRQIIISSGADWI